MKMHKIIFAVVMLIIVLASCKQKSKESTLVDIFLYNPITNEPYSDIEFKIALYEKIDKFGLEYDSQTEIIWSGKTNVNGRLQHSFRALKNDKYSYILSFPNLPTSDYYLAESYIPFQAEPVDLKLKKDEVNSKIFSYIRIVPQILYFKNMNCLNENDHIRYRYKSPYLDDFTEWKSSDIINNGYGCIDFMTSKPKTNEGVYEYELEVIRNGATDIMEYSFNLFGQNGIDTLKLFY